MSRGESVPHDAKVADERVRVWVVDDTASFRRATAATLAATGDFAMAGECENGESAIELIQDGDAGIVLMDIHMPGTGGIEATRAITEPLAPKTLDTRNRMAYWMGKGGDAKGAVLQLQALLPEAERALAPTDRIILSIRHNLGYWLGEAGDPAALQDVLDDAQRTQGAEDRELWGIRSNLAYWRGEAGDLEGAAASLNVELGQRIKAFSPSNAGPGLPGTPGFCCFRSAAPSCSASESVPATARASEPGPTRTTMTSPRH